MDPRLLQVNGIRRLRTPNLVRKEESLNRLSLDHMLLEDLGHIIRANLLIPDIVRVDHDGRAGGAGTQA